MTYRDAGVDIGAGTRAVELMKDAVKSTYGPEVLLGIGAFGGLFDAAALKGMAAPVLVASTDGVGTKIKIAGALGRYDTIGHDIVNHCINDILVQGATPLFFLDYLATGRLSPDVAEQIVTGVARACRENGCALIGGETAEMPGFYADGEYDIAGFIVGAVDRPRLIDGKAIRPGDVLIGLPSSGLHTNGYSLARKVFFELCGFQADTYVPELEGTAGDVLLATHRSYLAPIRPLLQAGLVKGMAHITGGGITENLPRILPEGCEAEIRRGAWTVPPLFTLIAERGGIADDEMLRAFNMGIGLIVACDADSGARVLELLKQAGETGAREIGRVVEGAPGVRYVP